MASMLSLDKLSRAWMSLRRLNPMDPNLENAPKKSPLLTVVNSKKLTSRTLHYEKTTDKNKIQFQICRKLKQAFPSLTTRSAIFPNRIFSAASANNPFTFYCDCQKLPNKIIARINFDK